MHETIPYWLHRRSNYSALQRMVLLQPSRLKSKFGDLPIGRRKQESFVTTICPPPTTISRGKFWFKYPYTYETLQELLQVDGIVQRHWLAELQAKTCHAGPLTVAFRFFRQKSFNGWPFFHTYEVHD